MEGASSLVPLPNIVSRKKTTQKVLSLPTTRRGQGIRHSTLKHLTMVLQVFLPMQQALQSVAGCDTILALV